MDIIEHKKAFYDVIVLQTVLEEVRNQSVPLYNRLRALTAGGDGKRFYVFHNEFRQETFTQREEGETINDRNDRAIRLACAWYKSHIEKAAAATGSKAPEIVMISNDRDNLKKAKKDGLACASIRDYLESISGAEELVDMISALAEEETETKTSKKDMLYPEVCIIRVEVNTG